MILEVFFHFCERKHLPIFSAFSYDVELKVTLPVTGLRTLHQVAQHFYELLEFGHRLCCLLVVVHKQAVLTYQGILRS